MRERGGDVLVMCRRDGLEKDSGSSGVDVGVHPFSPCS